MQIAESAYRSSYDGCAGSHGWRSWWLVIEAGEQAGRARQYIGMEGEVPMAGGGRVVDPGDFEVAFREHFPLVFRFISRRVGTAIAEDLAAETFATAYRRRASFDPGQGSLRSWLCGIATNLVRNHWRAEQHLLQLDARLMPEMDLPDSADAVERRVTAALLAPRLAAALETLTRDQRDVLLLYVWADLSQEEIAAALGVAPGTVRSRLSRARAALREQLDDLAADLWMRDGPDASPVRGGLRRDGRN
jgi:RNA polymerase sigma factor (sigma-70 family)